MSYRRMPPNTEEMVSLKVDNLTYRTTTDMLKRVFEKYGDVGDVYIPRDPYTQDSRGFAFVRYYDERDADDAIERLNGALLDGRELRVQLAKHARPPQSASYSRRQGPQTKRNRRRSYSRSRSRSRSRGRRRRRSRSRSHSRSRRKHRRSRSDSRRRSRSGSRHHSRSGSKSPRRSHSRSRSQHNDNDAQPRSRSQSVNHNGSPARNDLSPSKDEGHRSSAERSPGRDEQQDNADEDYVASTGDA